MCPFENDSTGLLGWVALFNIVTLTLCFSGFYSHCKQVNLLQGCSNSTVDLPMKDLTGVPAMWYILFLWAILQDSVLQAVIPHWEASTQDLESGILLRITQQFFVKIECLCCRPACIILKISPLLLVGDRKQQSDSLIPKVRA